MGFWRKRMFFRHCAEVIAQEVEREGYEFWKAKEERVTFERTFEGVEVQVEINKLEDKNDYVHVSILVDDGGLNAYCPPGTSVLVYNPQRKAKQIGKSDRGEE